MLNEVTNIKSCPNRQSLCTVKRYRISGADPHLFGSLVSSTKFRMCDDVAHLATVFCIFDKCTCRLRYSLEEIIAKRLLSM